MRSAYIFFLKIIVISLVACSEKHKSDDMQRSKIDYFRKYVAALDDCKELSTDSILMCAKLSIDIDTVSGIDNEVWHYYGKAKALVHNKREAEAIGIINEFLIKMEKFDLLFERAEFLTLRSFVYRNNFKHYLAAEDAYSAADIFLRLGLLRSASAVYLDIANLQYNVGNYSLAIENGRRVLNLLDDSLKMERADSVVLMNVSNTLGLTYFRVNNLDSAEYYYNISYDLAVRLKNEFWQGLVKGNSARILAYRGNTEEAIDNFRYDIGLSVKHNEFSSAGAALISIGDLYVQMNKLHLAKKCYDSAYFYLKSVEKPAVLSRYYKNVSHWYERNNDPVNAYNFFKKHISLRDSIENVQVSTQMQRIQDQRQFEKQLADIDLLKAENDHRTAELRLSRISLIALILVFVLLSTLLFTIRRNYKTLNALNVQLEDKVRARTDKLKKINAELDTYLYRASHDVRRPILTIIGLSHIADASRDEEERLEIHKSIKKTAVEMDNMLKKLQMAYELEKETGFFTVNVNSHIHSVVYTIQKDFPGVAFSANFNKEVVIKSNPRLMEIVLTNVIENACVFSKNGSSHEVSVGLNRTADAAKITVRDNGVGIESCYLNDIFGAYTRFSNKSQGCGLGLYLAMKAVNRIGGHIEVSSKVNEGSEFLITIPVDYAMMS